MKRRGNWADLGHLMRGLFGGARVYPTERIDKRRRPVGTKRQGDMFGRACAQRCGECGLWWVQQGSCSAEGWCGHFDRRTKAQDGEKCPAFRRNLRWEANTSD